MKSNWSLILAVFCFSSVSIAAPKPVEYKDGDTVLEGLVSFPKGKKQKGAAVLVVPEWNGISGQTKKRLDQLADLGYIAFAADIYGKGVRPATPEESGKTASIYKNDRALFKKRMNLALETLKKQKGVDSKRIVAIGYCFGGTGVLELARSGSDVRGVVSFHGGLGTPNAGEAKNIKTKVLALHGADDPYVSETEVAAFEKEMRDGSVDWQLVKYSGAVHSFTNSDAGTDNSKGAAYNASADRRSWTAMKDFFAEVL